MTDKKNVKEIADQIRDATSQWNSEEKIEEARSRMVELTKKDQREIANILANAITVGLAQIENLVGENFKSSVEALEFSDEMITLLRRRYRSELAKAMRRFDRLGSHRTAVLMRKKLEKL